MDRGRWRQSVVAAATAACLYPAIVLGESLPPTTMEIKLVPRNTAAKPSGVLAIDGGRVSRTLPVESPSVVIAADVGASLQIALRADGWWAPRTTFTVPDKASQAVVFPVWRTGRVRGRIAVEKGPLPKELGLVAESPPDPDRASEIERGTEFRCPVNDDGTWECDLPATVLDLAIRVPGFTPHYRWGTNVSAERITDFTPVVLKKGASLLAWLDRDSAQMLRSPARATLSRMLPPGQASAAAARLAAPVAEATFDKKGSVQLAPLPPGIYVLAVTAEGFAATHAHPIEVEEGLETILRRSIRLERPLRVRVEISPAADPHGAPWTLSLKRRSDFSAGFDPFPDATTETDERGVGTIHHASPGDYSVFVRDSRGNRLLFADWSILDEGSAARRIDIPAIDVRGTVTLAKKPVAATLSFGGTHGAVRVQMTSDQEGKFRGSLPRSGQWKVAVRKSGHQPAALVDVDVPEDGDVAIELPDTTVSGVVLDSQGNLVDRARVTLLVPDTALTARTDPSGRFAFQSVPVGRRTLTATDAAGNETSDPVNVDVTAEAPAVAGIELKLLLKRAITGRIISRGNPVVGARVRARPVNVRATAATAISDTRGAFKLELREDSRRVNFVVTAAGHALQAFEIDTGSAPAVLELARDGGTLMLQLPETFAGLELLLNGVRISSADVFRWTEMLGETRRNASDRQRISNVAPGLVQVCITLKTSASPACRSGQLAQGGFLQLGWE